MNKELLGVVCWAVLTSARAACPYDANCLNNPYGVGHPCQVGNSHSSNKNYVVPPR